jgi:FkbM family methyltransferase
MIVCLDEAQDSTETAEHQRTCRCGCPTQNHHHHKTSPPHASNEAACAGAWERSDGSTLLASLLDVEARGQANPVFLDIGANLGCFSLAIAALGYNVIAFEGMPRNQMAIYSSLCATPSLLDTFTLFPFAVGDEEADCTMVSDSINKGDGHMVCTEEIRNTMLGNGYSERGHVHVVLLGDYLAGVRVDVMKMDVEGFEPKVIAGAGASNLPLLDPCRIVVETRLLRPTLCGLLVTDGCMRSAKYFFVQDGP